MFVGEIVILVKSSTFVAHDLIAAYELCEDKTEPTSQQVFQINLSTSTHSKSSVSFKEMERYSTCFRISMLYQTKTANCCFSKVS